MEVKQPKIELVDIEKLIDYVNNAKTHSEEQIEKVASSIKEFGFINPIVIDKDFGIVAGHCRSKSAKKLGLTKVPCIIADHLTEAQKKAYVLADNRLAEYGSGWDKDLLKIELDDIKDNFNLDDIGFDAGFLSELDIDFSVDGDTQSIDSTKDDNVDGAKEFSEDDFSKFDNQCPKCGFEFDNKKG